MLDAAKRFRESLADLRKRRNWTQEELGARTGLTRETVAAWEQGRAMGEAVNKLVAVADALGVTLDELCGRSIRRAPELAIAETVVALLGDRLHKIITETITRTVADGTLKPADWIRLPGDQSSVLHFGDGTRSASNARRRRRTETPQSDPS
jgi:transcriptional regulator with XRE-family HTH domain